MRKLSCFLLLFGLIACAKKDVINIEDLQTPYFGEEVQQSSFIKIYDTYRTSPSSNSTYVVDGAIDFTGLNPLPKSITLNLFLNGNKVEVFNNDSVTTSEIAFNAQLQMNSPANVYMQGVLDIKDGNGIQRQNFAKIDSLYFFRVK